MVDKLLAWLRSLPGKIADWWEKFSKRQKTTIVILALVVLVAFGILIFAMTRPEYVTIYTAKNATEANDVMALLEGDDIAYQTSEDGMIIKINRKDYTKAVLLLGSNSITTDAFTIDNVTNGGFFTTESDTQKKYIVYLEDTLEQTLEYQTFVKDATVHLNLPEENGTLIAQNQEASASVMLVLSDVCTADSAAAMARLIATALGNDTTDHITIMDNEGTLLYSGAESNEGIGNVAAALDVSDKVAQSMRNEVKKVLAATQQFSSIEVAANVMINQKKLRETTHTYSNTEEEKDGVLASRDTYHSESTGSVSGIPGTDSNVETGYMYENNQTDSTLVNETSEDFLPDEYIRDEELPVGAIEYSNSSVAVSLVTYNVIREDDVKEDGLLDGISWEQYKRNNDIKTKLEVDSDIVGMVSNATGVPTSRITVVSYEEPFFVDHEGLNIGLTDVLQILLILLIMGLLLFVILRSMHQAKTEVPEPEISIDDILVSTPVEEMADIGVEDKSEARKIVEKFVEDNPDAAANLLRNWLNEDWD